MTGFVTQVIRQLIIGEDSTRVAAVSMSSGIADRFMLSDYFDSNQIITHISQMT